MRCDREVLAALPPFSLVLLSLLWCFAGCGTQPAERGAKSTATEASQESDTAPTVIPDAVPLDSSDPSIPAGDDASTASSLKSSAGSTSGSGKVATGDAPRDSDSATDAGATVEPSPTSGSTSGGGASRASGGEAPGLSRASDAGARADGVVDIVFEDIELPIQADIVFRPFMLTEKAKSLDGRKVRINGYMLPDSKTKGIKQFVLLKNTECKFGPGGQADHLINVLMNDGVTTNFRDDPITVQGTLTINPFQGPDGNTWSIYDVACERVELYQPKR
jgi:hypothetical protein